jgi:hypothetical protein
MIHKDFQGNWTSKWIHPYACKYGILNVPNNVDGIDSFTATRSYPSIELHSMALFLLYRQGSFAIFIQGTITRVQRTDRGSTSKLICTEYVIKSPILIFFFE